MNETEEALYQELLNKKVKTGAEKAKLKSLGRKFKSVNAKSAVKSNVFGNEATTKCDPQPVRFTSKEKSGLVELGNDIKRENLELVVSELGGLKEINNSKLIRAAVLLLNERSHEEIVRAIKQVKLNMIR